MDSTDHAVAIVGVGAILPDAPNAATFWENVLNKRYSISETPADRWSVAYYYDPDPKAPDKTYSKIGGWVRGFSFDWRRFRIPPKVAGAMDEGQQWALTAAADALADYGYPERPLDTERTAVILGTAMGGEMHYITTQRIVFPEYRHALEGVPAFSQLPPAARQAILQDWHATIDATVPPITEDSMPGELPNIVSGRVANVLNLRGPNFITDAACASSFAAIEAAVGLLTEHKVDAVITGGVDRNMGVGSFVKFCKIGALSATGTRPFGDGADGFVMGEGTATFLLKRLEDAERNGDKIYAVIRGVAGASDGKGKGITAPNPVGQRLAVQRAWEHAGLDPATASLIEAHGTSTRVGDVVEVESLNLVFAGAPPGSIALGSVKSNIGHLKAGAGAAGMLKATLALHHKVLPPTLNAQTPNPNIDFSASPFYLNHETQPWPQPNGVPRRVGVSAYGFGGTNFHLVLEEYVPGALTRKTQKVMAAPAGIDSAPTATTPLARPKPVRGILALGAATPTALKEKLDETLTRAEGGWTPARSLPKPADLKATERLVIDFGDHDELLDRLHKAQKVMGFDSPQAWKAMQAQGIFRGSGPANGKLAYLFPGQGSQYVNMGRELAAEYPIVAQTIAEADAVMTPILGRPLSSYIFIDSSDPAAVNQAQFDLMQTEITQPAMLTMDEALRRLLAQFGFRPDMVMGHSLGEYAALTAAGVMPFAECLEAAAARGSEMSQVKVEDNGKMAAVLAPIEVVEATLQEVGGYVVPANINSRSQCVIGGASQAVEAAVGLFESRGYRAMQLPVSHAFHTSIVAPASAPLRQMLDRLHFTPPTLPLVANLTGDFYPTEVEAIKDVLQAQVASPVQWVKGLETLYNAGVRTFLEVGPKRALRGFANDVFADKGDVLALLTNHPKQGELPTFNQALCGLYAAGFGVPEPAPEIRELPVTAPAAVSTPAGNVATTPEVKTMPQSNDQLGQLLAQALQQLAGQQMNAPAGAIRADQFRQPYDRNELPLGSVVISGTGLGLPGAEKPVMDPDNALRILRGEQFVDLIPTRFRQKMVDKRIVRLVKAEDGSGSFATIDNTDEVIKLAGRPGYFDLTEEYGVPDKLIEALDITTQLAMAAGLDALREAGIPLVQTYKRTTTGKYLPQNWLLPEALRDETGVIFASAFPGGDRFADEFSRYYAFQGRLDKLAALEDLRRYTNDSQTLYEIDRRIADLHEQIEAEPYHFDRRFLFRILCMGHSQFAQYIGARGPNAHVNAACASTAQGVAVAEDWIRTGRCRRVIVIGADNVTGDQLLEWVGAGFLGVGAITTSDKVDEAALPFDRRRHGTIMGMGACALVIESEDAVRERGMRGLVELLSSETSNSAFHGTRLDVDHIAQVMNNLVTAAERRFGLHRHAMASQLVFMSHETFTPARGGSASAEVVALRSTFGEAANEIVVANTKGFTGHPMGVGVEDVIAVKILEYGIVPPVPNFKEVDPDLGPLNLSRGGRYPVQYALHLAAGFGSQIAMTLTRRIPGSLDRVDNKPKYQRWLADVSGYDWAETEVEKRVLRVKAQGNPLRQPLPSNWQYGTGPTVRAIAPESVAGTAYRPAPMADLQASLGFTAPPVYAAPDGPHHPRERAVTPPPIDVPVPAPAPAGNGQPQLPYVPEAAPAVPVDAPRPVDIAPTPEPVVPLPYVSPTHHLTPAAPAGDPIAPQVLAIVAEQTGYPEDMLELDLDLEADLGVDTVKQAETFQAIRAAFDIPRRDNLNLRDYNTLERVIGFVREMRPDLVAPPATPSPSHPVTPSPAQPAAPADSPTAPSSLSLDAADTMPRRVPVPTLRPALAWCKPTGIVLDENSRVVVMFDEGGVAKALVSRLEKLGVTVLAIETAPAGELLAGQLKIWLEEGPIQGVYWLPALDVEPDLEMLDLATWRELNRQRVKNLAITMRTLYEAVSAPGSFLVSATRLGGLHGYGEEGATAPLGGGVVGFSKAYKRERGDVLVKAVDFAHSRKTASLADLLIAETLTDPGVVEVGYWQENRYAVTLVERPAGDGQPGLTLNNESIFLVTGAAGGITSAIIGDLAAASGGTFYLLDLVAAPPAGDPQIALFRQDKEALKQQLIVNARLAGDRPTPVQIEKQMLAIERQEAALRAIEMVQAAGGTAHYHSVDLLDGPAVAAIVAQIGQAHGRLDVLIHAGGIEISRGLADKEQAQFDLVYDIKADGFFSLLQAAQGLPIGATVAFSSVAGRFGNSGQTDYSAANDLLCKLTSSLRRWRPETRGIVIDWTAWGGIGMATRGSVPKIMAMAGIEMLPPEAGIPTVRRELVAGAFRGEIVVGGALGILTAEWDETGGLDVDKVNAAAAERKLLMTGRVNAARLYGGLDVETVLDPQEQPFLYDHAMDGTPLLPGVMGTEGFAQLASLLLPGYTVAAVENEVFESPFKFYRMEPRTLHWQAVLRPEANGDLLAETVLRSVRELNKPGVPPQEKVHFKAQVRLVPAGVPQPDPIPLPALAESAARVGMADIYRVYFHGPAYQVLDWVQVDGDRAIGQMAADLPPNTRPGDAASLMAPRLVELCFQTAGIWEARQKQVLALPWQIGAVTTYRQPAAANGQRLYALVEAVNGEDGDTRFNAQVVDESGAVYVDLRGYRTVALPGTVAL